MVGRRLLALGSACAALAAVAPAAHAGPVGRNPSHNIAPGKMPDACYSAPKGASCLAAAVHYLDRGRAALHQPAYRLPKHFDSLAAADQILVLSDEDRLRYHLGPVPGLTAALDANAQSGVRDNRDPVPTQPGLMGFTSNWAFGLPNAVYAYGVWMYDDGLGSGNLDCTSSHRSGCWGHRHDVLWRFSGGTLAMGAAAGRSGSGGPAYAMLIVEGGRSFRPDYDYTWSQALRAGA